MKYSAQNLAKGLLKVIKADPENSQEIIVGFINFCKTKHLTHLLPNFLKYFKLEAKKDEDKKTLRIFSAINLDENITKTIKSLVGADESSAVEKNEDKKIIAGFIAYYQNRIIDASLDNNLRLLKNKLINA